MIINLKDMNGEEVEVTDLDLALMQADDYRHYRITEPTKSDLQRYAYWEDMYQKLLALKTNLL